VQSAPPAARLHRDGETHRLGGEYPDNIHNGEWEYQAFRADRSVNHAAKLQNCFTCHKPLGTKVDYVFSYDKMK